MGQCGGSRSNYLKKYPASQRPRVQLRHLSRILLSAFLVIPSSAFCEGPEWGVAIYGGQYYDTEPAGIVNRKANFLNQYIVAVSAGKTVWRAQTLPLSLEIEGILGQQFGLASLNEIGIAPVIRWSSFPWKEYLQTDFRVGPLGASYTTMVSPLERGQGGNGSQFLNLFLVELAFSLPRMKPDEVFVRLHHRCTIYDFLNNYGANGEDFLALGYRQYF